MQLFIAADLDTTRVPFSLPFIPKTDFLSVEGTVVVLNVVTL